MARRFTRSRPIESPSVEASKNRPSFGIRIDCSSYNKLEVATILWRIGSRGSISINTAGHVSRRTVGVGLEQAKNIQQRIRISKSSLRPLPSSYYYQLA